jgi:hypothetical protein
MKPTPKKPRIIIAHVDGSGTATTGSGTAGTLKPFVPKLIETPEIVDDAAQPVQASVKVPVWLM